MGDGLKQTVMPKLYSVYRNTRDNTIIGVVSTSMKKKDIKTMSSAKNQAINTSLFGGAHDRASTAHLVLHHNPVAFTKMSQDMLSLLKGHRMVGAWEEDNRVIVRFVAQLDNSPSCRLAFSFFVVIVIVNE